jgi:pimeloyl-ACP methyl ester carboxylesterase
MTIRSESSEAGHVIRAHSNEVFEIHERMLAGAQANRRYIELRSGRRIHAIEIGDGPSLVLLHGSGTSSLSFLPVLERLRGVRAIAVDRPGFGLSEAVLVPRARFREAAVEFLDEVLDGLGLEKPALAGNSMGGTWALWYALARPERVRKLVLLGSAPLLPHTRAPAPLRAMTTPVVGDVLTRVMKPNRKRLVQLMSSLGEKQTIVRYPELIEALVAVGGDPLAATTNLAELRAVITPFGFRRSARVSTDELRGLTVPTLLIWGDHDPVGAAEVAQLTATAIREARLELLDAGHVPYLGQPERASEQVSRFVRAERDG